MNTERDGTLLRRHLIIDPRRHPLLSQWVMNNPYHWPDALREVLERELQAGNVPANLGGQMPAKPKRRPRGVAVTRMARGKTSTPTSSPSSSVLGAETPRVASAPASVPAAPHPQKENQVGAAEAARDERDSAESDKQRKLMKEIARKSLLQNSF